MVNSLATDLNHILYQMGDLWEELRDQRIFITGGTGFFGCWLLESFAWANERLNLGASALVLTRNPETFRQKAPHLTSNPAIQFHTGDTRTFDFPKGDFSYIIHGATQASAKLNQEDPLLMFDTVVEGTRHTLDFARVAQVKNFLLTSSGAVYGRQPSEMTHISEEYLGSPDLTKANAAYGEGKRAAEMLCSLYAQQYGINTKIARCFAFAGPYLPLDTHFAIGNFILNGLKGQPILIKGDGTPFRSYLYAADLVIWLWTILLKGKPCHPYNVGSDEDLTIAELGQVVASIFNPRVEVIIAKKAIPEQPIERYVPSVERAFKELQLKPLISLKEAIMKTAEFA